MFRLGILVFILFFAISSSGKIIVSNTADDGSGSLRQAIIIAEISADPDTIIFNIPFTDSGFDATSGTFNIELQSTLPDLISGQTYINGSSQANFNGNTNSNGPEIFIKGLLNLETAFRIFSMNNQINGIGINGFYYGLILYGNYAHNNLIYNCYIGTEPDGTASRPNHYGVLIMDGASSNQIKDCLISGNLESGIIILHSDFTSIIGCKIGTDFTGHYPLPNKNGILADSASNNTIGNGTFEGRNYISGNQESGVSISGAISQNNIISSNYIGTDISGSTNIPNRYGIVLNRASETKIGPGNTISGNKEIGILLTGKYTEYNKIIGNKIGTDVSGTEILPNDKGIVLKSLANHNLIGGNSQSDRNIISGNIEIGIYIESADSNKIQGNYIGTDISGQFKVSSANDSLVQGNGVEFNIVAKGNELGGPDSSYRNIISGHKVYGVVYYGNCRNNTTQGNYIGTDKSGFLPLPNATGICLDCASNHNSILDNLISGNISYGIFFVTRGTDYNVMKRNLIGTDARGLSPLPNDIGMVISTGASNNLIGGDSILDGNTFSGNYLSGLMITNNLTSLNTIKNNKFGTCKNGSNALPNLYGLMLSSFPKNNLIESNIISGNQSAGVIINEEADSNILISNFIGTNREGLVNLGNGSAGIFIDQASQSNTIGGIGQGNVIAFNKGSGIFLQHSETKYNRISSNEYYQNLGPGIDIFPYGVNQPYIPGTPGTQDLINAPIIDSVVFCADSLSYIVFGNTFCLNPEGIKIELYQADDYNQSSIAQGKILIGSTTTDQYGKWKISLCDLTNEHFLLATATDLSGNTSEFSLGKALVLRVTDINDDPIGFNVWPNPVKNEIYASTSQPGQYINEFSMINSMGEILINKKITKSNLLRIDVSELSGNKASSGLYFLKAQLSCGVTVYKKILVL